MARRSPHVWCLFQFNVVFARQRLAGSFQSLPGVRTSSACVSLCFCCSCVLHFITSCPTWWWSQRGWEWSSGLGSEELNGFFWASDLYITTCAKKDPCPWKNTTMALKTGCLEYCARFWSRFWSRKSRIKTDGGSCTAKENQWKRPLRLVTAGEKLAPRAVRVAQIHKATCEASRITTSTTCELRP